jgi:hypothetical protein
MRTNLDFTNQQLYKAEEDLKETRACGYRDRTSLLERSDPNRRDSEENKRAYSVEVKPKAARSFFVPYFNQFLRNFNIEDQE